MSAVDSTPSPSAPAAIVPLDDFTSLTLQQQSSRDALLQQDTPSPAHALLCNQQPSSNEALLASRVSGMKSVGVNGSNSNDSSDAAASNGNGRVYADATTAEETRALLEARMKMKGNKPDLLVFRGGKWVSAPASEMADAVTFDDIKYFYANIIDYARVVLCVMAAYTMTTDWHWTTAGLIIVSTLLDWIDGPIARAYNQCSIQGSGWDWCADILAQLLQITWWCRYDINVFPILFICTTIEVTNCIFDFATTATCKYPNLAEQHSGWMKILDWSLAKNNYNSFFYTAQWLAYPFYCVGRALEHAIATPAGLTSPLAALFLLNRIVCFPLAVAYIWCEAAYCWHIIRSWTEPSRKKKPSIEAEDVTQSAMGGFINYGSVEDSVKPVLQNTYNDLLCKMRSCTTGA